MVLFRIKTLLKCCLYHIHGVSCPKKNTDHCVVLFFPLWCSVASPTHLYFHLIFFPPLLSSHFSLNKGHRIYIFFPSFYFHHFFLFHSSISSSSLSSSYPLLYPLYFPPPSPRQASHVLPYKTVTPSTSFFPQPPFFSPSSLTCYIFLLLSRFPRLLHLVHRPILTLPSSPPSCGATLPHPPFPCMLLIHFAWLSQCLIITLTPYTRDLRPSLGVVMATRTMLRRV